MLFIVSLCLFILVLYMLVGCIFMSTVSLVAECPLWFPSVAIVFDFFLAAAGVCPIVFFLVGVSV